MRTNYCRLKGHGWGNVDQLKLLNVRITQSVATISDYYLLFIIIRNIIDCWNNINIDMHMHRLTSITFSVFIIIQALLTADYKSIKALTVWDKKIILHI